MKKLPILGTVVLLAAATQVPAMAATGTVLVAGNVPTKCSLSSGPAAKIELNDLSDSSGHVVGTFAAHSAATLTFTCTGIAPTVSVSANHGLQGPSTGGASGYTNIVNYVAHATPKIETGAAATAATYDTAASSGTPSTLTGHYLDNASDNVSVDVDTPSTPTPTNLLVASGANGTDGYTSTITVTLTAN